MNTISQKAAHRRSIKKHLEIISDTVSNPLIDNTESIQISKGRCKDLIKARDLLLLTRYWYYFHFTKLRFDIVIEALSNEFFITQRRISDIVQADDRVIFELRKTKPTIKELKEIYPFMVWDVKS